VHEPNRHFATTVVADRCVGLANDRDLIRGLAGFHRRPKRSIPT
jgi:hypothetical protein